MNETRRGESRQLLQLYIKHDRLSKALCFQKTEASNSADYDVKCGGIEVCDIAEGMGLSKEAGGRREWRGKGGREVTTRRGVTEG